MNASDAVALVEQYADDGGLPGKDDGFGNGTLDIRRLQERNTKGIYDAALADVVILNETTNSSTVMVTVQNRGTEDIPSASLTVATASSQVLFGINNLKAGETTGKEVKLLNGDFDSNGITVITAEVRLNGAIDAYPANNGRRVTIMRKTDRVQAGE
jgi:hypothetical protein